MKDFLDNDPLLTSYFDRERKAEITLPDGIEGRIMSRVQNRAAEPYELSKTLIWSCIGVIAVVIAGLGVYFNYSGLVNFSVIYSSLTSITVPEFSVPALSLPKLEITPTPMGGFWLAIGVIAMGFMICSLYLSRRLHSKQ